MRILSLPIKVKSMPFKALLFSGLLMGLWSCNADSELPFKNSGAAESLDTWFTKRMDNSGELSVASWVRGFRALQSSGVLRGGNGTSWTSMGPHNIGGRTLCIAFHPFDPNIIFAGSASGGLWVTKTGGVGAQAWERVPIGHPVLGVSSIIIDPGNPDRMWIGTGEMYSNGEVKPGTINRFTRGTYGIGILKTNDGGKSWSPSLDWSYGEMRGVQKLALNPLNTDVLYAATSEGVYRTYNGGSIWTRILDVPMAVDIYVHPVDTQIVLVTTGSFFTTDAGLYRSENGGNLFNKIKVGFPFDYTGKTMLAGNPSNPDEVYAYVADVLEGQGLFRSTNTGVSWELINSTNISLYQGWYSHDLAVNPAFPSQLMVGGIDVYRSPNAGAVLLQTGIWESGAYGKVPAGGPEGPPYYVHADVHDIQFHPLKTDEAWIATDGGLFVTTDGGQSFTGRNGGYQTQQFYSRFSSSIQDPAFSIGGMQDNATAIYEGDKDWVKVIGGDGMTTAIAYDNDQQVLASIQDLVLQRSLNRGLDFSDATPPLPLEELRAFNGAATLDPNNSDRILAGGQRLYRTEAFGEEGSWEVLQTDPIDGDNIITRIEIAPGNSQRVIVVTSSDPILTGGVNTGKLFVSNTGGEGTNWQTAKGLGDNYCTAVAFHPTTNDTVMATFGGFGGPHLYRSVDAGLNWEAWGADLPNIPVNSIAFDPFEPSHLYLANDLSVYLSTNGGASWEPFNSGLPESCLAMDLHVSIANKSVRVATHGSGAYEIPLKSQSVSLKNVPFKAPGILRNLYPNPVGEELNLEFGSGINGPVQCYVYTIEGVKCVSRTISPNEGFVRWRLPDLPTGVYLLELRQQGRKEIRSFIIAP